MALVELGQYLPFLDMGIEVDVYFLSITPEPEFPPLPYRQANIAGSHDGDLYNPSDTGVVVTTNCPDLPLAIIIATVAQL